MLESEPPEVDVRGWVGVVVTIPPFVAETVVTVLLVSIAVEGGVEADITEEALEVIVEVSACPATNTRGRSSPKKRRCRVPTGRHGGGGIKYFLGTYFQL